MSDASNPESGFISYTCDANGNLLKRKDARQITTTLTYDGQNRVTDRKYDDGVTPEVTLTYDTPCLKRYLCEVKGVSTTDYRYNALGQVTSSTQTTDGTPYTFIYGYSLAGDLKTVTYPSGRVASYGLSLAGRAQSVGSWATGITYAPHGAISG